MAASPPPYEPKKKFQSRSWIGQQRDSSCFLYPFLNFNILKGEVSSGKEVSRPWHTKKEWFVKNNSTLASWHLAMKHLLNETEYPNFAALHKSWLDKGINMTDVKNWQTIDGKPFINDEMEGLFKTYLSPYIVSQNDVNKKSLPIFLNDHNELVVEYFDKSTNKFKSKNYGPIEKYTKGYKYKNGSIILATDFGEINFNEIIEPEILESLSLDKNMLINIKEYKDTKPFGMKAMAHTIFIPEEHLKLYENYKVGYLYCTGLYNFMLFAMGLDENNEEINEEHKLYLAYQEFKAAMAKYPNPWSFECFKKDNLFEYQLANLLKNNPELKEKAIKAMSGTLSVWDIYNQLENLRDKDGNIIDRSVMPGEDQMLAYTMAQQLIYTWAQSLGDKALLSVLELDELDLDNGTINFIAAKIKIKINSANEKFLEFWDEIKDYFKDKTLISFHGHGTIMDFSMQELSRQLENSKSKKKEADLDTQQRLGFAVLDSCYSEGIQPYYQITPDSAADIIKRQIKRLIFRKSNIDDKSKGGSIVDKKPDQKPKK